MEQVLKSILAALFALQLFAPTNAARGATRGAEGAAAVGSRAGRVTPAAQKRGRRPGRGRKSDALTPGVWGGERIRLEVTERGANVEYDCAHGTVEGRIAVDGGGRFGVSGDHYEEHAGPSRAGESAPRYRVRLTGSVGGSLMKLTVTREDTKELIGTYSLARGREAGLVKCH